MNYIRAENISKDYGERLLFSGLTFGINKGDKTALIANNGTGKSTLLNILAGLDVPQDGEVIRKEGLRIGYLQQNPEFDPKLSINDLFKGEGSYVLKIIREYEAAVDAQTEAYNEQTQKRFEEASIKMDQVEGWDYEQRLESVLTQFGITDLSQKTATLSGGQKKRLALAHILLDHPDLLILDEPTNHLDVEMIEWLESYLKQSNITFFIVTHDRYFLDRICNHILELEDNQLYRHKGNYELFLKNKEEREVVFQTETDKAKKQMKKELEWIRRMPKARTTKSKSRIDAFEDIKAKASRKKSKHDLKLEVKMSRIGGKILELKKVYKSYGEINILNGFDYSFKKGERIGVVGKNGVGKSTFLNLLTGKEQPDSGKIKSGETIVYGYYTQDGLNLKEDKRVIEVLKDIADVIELANGAKITASQFLQHFMFPPEMQYTFVSKLSGGEKRRLYLLTVLIKNPNFLILDEPTNDLDILTLNKLEEFLMHFPGCLILVSHDRYFMDQLIDHLFIFKGDGVIKDFNGNYTDYRESLKVEAAETKQAEQKAKKAENVKSTAPVPPRKKLTYKDKLEYETLEKEIEKLEAEKTELEKQMANESANADHEILLEKSQRLSEVMKAIDEKTLRWMELEEVQQQ
ncbi:MAG: ABC-F family ATP-binding cassette domain-containing protein [Chitinophagales bacterium]